MCEHLQITRIYMTLWLVVFFCFHVLINASTETGSFSPKVRRLGRQLEFIPGSLQSGPDFGGSSFASAGYVEPASQTLHIVGTTYGNWWSKTGANAGGVDHPSCFYAIAQLPTSTTTSMTWIHSQLIGTGSAEEGCRGLLLDHIRDRLYIIGFSDPTNALLSDLFDTGSLSFDNNVKQLGTIIDCKLSSNGDYKLQQDARVEGGRVIAASRVNYPVAMTGDANSLLFYTISMISSATGKNLLWGNGLEMDPGQFFHYGTNYEMEIQEFGKDPPDAAAADAVQVSVKPGRSIRFGTESAGGVYVAEMLQLPDRLIVTGFTAGFGYGLNTTNGQKMDVGNTDGFVTQIGLSDMKLVPNVSPYRIASGLSDFVTGACYSPATTGNFYVTGFTEGSFIKDNPAHGSARGFIMKLTVQGTLAWVQEFEPTLTPDMDYYVAEAISCAVTSDGNNVYVAGTVDAGGSFGERYGEIDVWVAQLSAASGSTVFIQQFGSTLDDSVARRGGVQVDADDNLVLIGNTNGKVYRDRDPTTEPYHMDDFNDDVFVATFRLNDGSHTLPNTAARVPAPRPTPAPAASSRPKPNVDEEEDPNDVFPIRNSILLFLITLPIVLCLYRALTFLCPGSKIRRDVPTHRSKVLGYLHDFEVENIELKHSATGGWHCSYLNELAKGINKRDEQDDLFSLSSRSSRGSRKTRSSRASTAAADDSSSSSLDKVRPVPTRIGSPSRPQPGIEGFADEIFSVADDDEDLMSFGSSRTGRRERRNLKTASMYQDSPTRESRRKARSRASSQSMLGTTSTAGSLLSTTTLGSNRASRAKERWQNREII